MHARALALAACCGASLGRFAPARADSSLVPGLMGFNALPALQNPDPVVGTRVELELGVASQSSGLAGRDAAATPTFRLSVPFGEVAAVDFEGTPVEWWQVTRETQQRLRAKDARGVAPGDVRFGARFLVSGETSRRPALGVRFSVKSTTGKELDNRRFTSSPGYVIDGIAGKDLVRGEGPLRRLRVLAKLGFSAWQLGFGDQDDAIDYGLTAKAWFPGLSIATEWRGFRGFLARDRPSLLGITVGRALAPRFEVTSTVNVGVSRDAPPIELRLGFVLSLDR